ncbi:hypothetical protein IAU60_006867 [Kwoniella sp. DSM 27419]
MTIALLIDEKEPAASPPFETPVNKALGSPPLISSRPYTKGVARDFGPPSSSAGEPGRGSQPSGRSEHILATATTLPMQRSGQSLGYAAPPPAKLRQKKQHPPQTSEQSGLPLHSLDPPFIRPHPLGPFTGFFINSFPTDLPEIALAEALRDCLPLKIKLDSGIPSAERILPDLHYDWMPKNGTIELLTTANAEKGLAILANHAVLCPRGLWVSPYPPPNILPPLASPTSARYIRPTALIRIPELPADATMEAIFKAFFPTPSEVYDAVRPWGSVRSVNVYLQQTLTGQGAGQPIQGHLWLAKVEFWYDDEASRFDFGFGEKGWLIKGWQVMISSGHNPTAIVPPPIEQPLNQSYNITTSPASIAREPLSPIGPIHYVGATTPANTFGPMQTGYSQLPIPSMPVTPITPSIPFNALNPFTPFLPAIPAERIPQTPPSISYTAPWANHNLFASSPSTEELSTNHELPKSPPTRTSKMHKSSLSSLDGKPKTWSLTVGASPDGEVRPTGLMADDGTYIQHGPGQHIRPAPLVGPGSGSVSGLVDYSNVFVKNLDPDINSLYLEEIFGNIGQIVSARVMRDPSGRSRGYGFVSYVSPEFAARAIEIMHDSVIGRSRVSVTLHEPRRLRMEKLGERQGQNRQHSAPVAFGRRSMSPIRPDNRSERKYWDGSSKPEDTTGDIRSLAPDERKKVLTERFAAQIKAYAQANRIAEDKIVAATEVLVAHDLALVSVLHDHHRLDEMIVEAFAVVQSGCPADTSTTPLALGHETPSQDEDPDKQDDCQVKSEQVISLREKISQIDPDNAEVIMAVLLGLLQPDDWATTWTDSKAATWYGKAKRELATLTSADTDVRNGSEITSADEAEITPTAPVDKQTAASGDLNPPHLERTDLKIDTLAALPAGDILRHLSGQSSQDIMSTLGLVPPESEARAELDQWLDRLKRLSKVSRKTQVVEVLSKKIDMQALKPSRKIKVIKELIRNEPDLDALCQLSLYPPLLKAKVTVFNNTPL